MADMKKQRGRELARDAHVNVQVTTAQHASTAVVSRIATRGQASRDAKRGREVCAAVSLLLRTLEECLPDAEATLDREGEFIFTRIAAGERTVSKRPEDYQVDFVITALTLLANGYPQHVRIEHLVRIYKTNRTP